MRLLRKRAGKLFRELEADNVQQRAWMGVSQPGDQLNPLAVSILLAPYLRHQF